MTADPDAPKLGDRVETSADGKTDRVGYCHPPRHTQFRPGQSGNPSGRPKRRRSFKADIAAALDAASTAAGDRTKQQAIAENLVNDALARTPLAIKIVAPIALALMKATAIAKARSRRLSKSSSLISIAATTRHDQGMGAINEPESQ